MGCISTVKRDGSDQESIPDHKNKSDGTRDSIEDCPSVRALAYLAMINVGHTPHGEKNNQSLFTQVNMRGTESVKSHLGSKSQLISVSTGIYQSSTISWSEYQRRGPSRILDNLYLGNKFDSSNEKKINELKITHILMVDSGSQHVVRGCKLMIAPMKDNGFSDLEKIMDRTFSFMDEAVGTGKLLVHCNLGQNRSPTLVIAWLMKRNGSLNESIKSLYDAYVFVKEKRPEIHPIIGYIQQLREIEKEVYGCNSVPPDFTRRDWINRKLVTAHSNWTQSKAQHYINCLQCKTGVSCKMLEDVADIKFEREDSSDPSLIEVEVMECNDVAVKGRKSEEVISAEMFIAGEDRKEISK